MIDTIGIAILLLKDIKSRLTVVSRKAKKKQHAHTSSGLHEHYSELFTRMAALKFENAVTQPLQGGWELVGGKWWVGGWVGKWVGGWEGVGGWVSGWVGGKGWVGG